MTWNYNKLRGKIREICGTEDEFASKLNINRSTLSKKLNNIVEFSQEEIYKSCIILGIALDEIDVYFFSK